MNYFEQSKDFQQGFSDFYHTRAYIPKPYWPMMYFAYPCDSEGKFFSQSPPLSLCTHEEHLEYQKGFAAARRHLIATIQSYHPNQQLKIDISDSPEFS